MRFEVTWRHVAYGTLLFECETDEDADQLLRLLQRVRHFSMDLTSRASVEEAIKDLVLKGFEDVTPQVERKCPGYDPAYVFRGPDGMRYRCWSESAVFRVFAAYERLGVKVPPDETWYHTV